MLMKRFYTYELTFPATGTIVAGLSSQQTFQVETAFDFYWLKAQAFIYDVNGLGIVTTTLPLLTVTLQEGSTQQNLNTSETAIANIFGTAQLPYILPTSHKIVGGSSFTATVFNRHAATAYSCKLSFSGLHVPAGSEIASVKRG
jgi:hypothetical protein